MLGISGFNMVSSPSLKGSAPAKGLKFGSSLNQDRVQFAAEPNRELAKKMSTALEETAEQELDLPFVRSQQRELVQQQDEHDRQMLFRNMREVEKRASRSTSTSQAAVPASQHDDEMEKERLRRLNIGEKSQKLKDEERRLMEFEEREAPARKEKRRSASPEKIEDSQSNLRIRRRSPMDPTSRR